MTCIFILFYNFFKHIYAPLSGLSWQTEILRPKDLSPFFSIPQNNVVFRNFIFLNNFDNLLNQFSFTITSNPLVNLNQSQTITHIYNHSCSRSLNSGSLPYLSNHHINQFQLNRCQNQPFKKVKNLFQSQCQGRTIWKHFLCFGSLSVVVVATERQGIGYVQTESHIFHS